MGDLDFPQLVAWDGEGIVSEDDDVGKLADLSGSEAFLQPHGLGWGNRVGSKRFLEGN